MARKSRNNPFDLPALELKCMKALWALGEATVEDIRASLLPARPLAYTTVMTVMDRLAHKGLVERQKRGRAHLYTSAVREESVREHAVSRLVENFFGGSREELRTHLSGAPRGESSAPPAEPISRPRLVSRAARKPKAPAPPAEGIDPALL
jgi:BlaI family transcriptional regulator, penicillinase repressor